MARTFCAARGRLPSLASITVDQAEALTGLDRATCYRRIGEGNGEWAVKPANDKSPNGKRAVLIRLGDLPADAQARYWAQQLTPSPAPAATSLNLAEIGESTRAEALRRLPIVHQAEDIVTSRHDVTARMKALAGQHDISPATLYN